MLGWIISLLLLFIGGTKGSTVLVITSGMFAIAGSIGIGLTMINGAIVNLGKKVGSGNDTSNE
jgi:hypothetical protein